jgi:type II secretory pathway component GspD/PulD (secretin)
LEDASKLKILAKPKILALDNQPALIKISTDQAIGSSTVTQSGGSGTSSSNTERYEVGTILRVTPLINTGGRITLTVEPSFATVDPSAIHVNGIGGGETGDPTTRTARTTLMVNDGQTIALGGMLFSNQSNDDRKVPFFGNIPVIGKALFTSNTKSIKDRELILFVTPYIITDPSMLQEPTPPGSKMDFNQEIAPFWKVKEKQWYRDLKEGREKKTDFDGYFNLRKRLIDSTLENIEQSTQVPASSKS